MANTTSPILTAEKLTKEFGPEQVLKGISLRVEAGEFTTILGPSGSGKSTLLSILSGLLAPTAGRVLYHGGGDPAGREITAMGEEELADLKRAEAGNVFQNYLLLGSLTAGENIRIGLPDGDTGREPVPFDQLVDTLGIGDILDKFPAQLSGGQQQRVAIARAVIKKPGILFCDEVTGALDEANSKRVVELLHAVNADYGITVLFVTHNLAIAGTARRVITIKDGLLHRDRVNENPVPAASMVWEQGV